MTIEKCSTVLNLTRNISTAWREKKATNLISNNIEKIVSPLNQSCVHLLTVYETK